MSVRARPDTPAESPGLQSPTPQRIPPFQVRLVTGVGTDAITLSLKAANLSDPGPPPPPPPPPMVQASSVQNRWSEHEGRYSAGSLQSPGQYSTGVPPAQASSRHSSGDGACAGGGAGGESAGSVSAIEVHRAAAEAMEGLRRQLTDIYEEAASEELMDRGGGEHGAAQAGHALRAAERMIDEWNRNGMEWAGGS